METYEVARFEHVGDVRRVFVTQDESGLVVREDLSGPSVLVAYGDESRSLRASFDAAAVESLLDAVASAGAEGSLREYLADERHDIVDLMDLCDARGVPYAFTGMGSESGIQFRPAR
ncbi:hypothetical protein [Olsenella profusa]|uniref:Uncharacterized protein n=1 Tax=Olsenella profusa TaxID=138595 RepID=A0ABS2F0A9_9ACTN|nr:hypothetical protein [Olsenella profusa]MBM6774411.1 hypothetical protein [Olsenella profusa]